jgi:hypothetical protein
MPPPIGRAAGRSRSMESSLEPDGIKVPRWKYIHSWVKEDS